MARRLAITTQRWLNLIFHSSYSSQGATFCLLCLLINAHIFGNLIPIQTWKIVTA